ncbi:MAG: hypothetical protein J5836_01335 [Clostridia bacterium]|nr:hypothetical protein [Clostridia bacterium]
MKKYLAIASSILIFAFSFAFRSREAFAYEEVNGEFKNIAVCVEFSDTEEKDGITDYALSSLEKVFNGETDSLKSFIGKNSQGKLNVATEFIRTVKIDKTSAYFQPRFLLNGETYEEINPEGYDNRRYTKGGEVSKDGELEGAEYYFREHEFVSLVLKALSGVELSGADRDDDGYIDGLTVIPCASVKVNLDDVNEWGSIFWPHMGTRFYGKTENLTEYYYVGDGEYEFEKVMLSGKTAYKYLVAPYDAIVSGEEKGLSVVCHEFMHILGAPDYYGYDSAEEYVGEFDIMGTAETATLSLTYLRERMGWIGEGEVLAVEESGEFFLKPTEKSEVGEVKAYKIVLSDYLETNDCYYIECRKLNGVYDGIIIYRVNEKNGFISANKTYGSDELGNIYGDPEVYIFRRQSMEQDLKKNAFLFDGFLSDRKYGSVSGNKNLITTSNGENTKIVVEVTGETREGYSFKVTIPESPEGDISLGAALEMKTDLKGRNYITFKNSYRKGYAYVLTTKETIKGLSAEDMISGKYGVVKKIPVSFQKCYLAKPNGKTNVYVCFSDGDSTSEIVSLSYGTDAFKISEWVIVAGAGAGFAVFIAIILTIKFVRKR